MAKFIVYQTTAHSGTRHRFIRSGDAPSNVIAQQAMPGETAIPWSGTPPTVAIDTGVTWLFDTSTSSFTSIASPLPAPSGAAHEARARALIKQRLRDTEWTQLPDAPLTAPQKAAYAAARAQWRDAASASNIASFGISWDVGSVAGLPPEFTGAE